MGVLQFEAYHGIVLTRMIRKDGLTEITFKNGDDKSWGAYDINENIRLLIKHRAKSIPPTACHSTWQFPFTDNQIIDILLNTDNKRLYLALVCACISMKDFKRMHVCLLNHDNISQVVDLDAPGVVSVRHERGAKKFRVKGNGRTISVFCNRIDTWRLT